MLVSEPQSLRGIIDYSVVWILGFSDVCFVGVSRALRVRTVSRIVTSPLLSEIPSASHPTVHRFSVALVGGTVCLPSTVCVWAKVNVDSMFACQASALGLMIFIFTHSILELNCVRFTVVCQTQLPRANCIQFCIIVMMSASRWPRAHPTRNLGCSPLFVLLHTTTTPGIQSSRSKPSHHHHC